MRLIAKLLFLTTLLTGALAHADVARVAGQADLPPWATGQSHGEDLAVYLVTFGPGDDIPSWFGHSALGVKDRAQKHGRLYNYGELSGLTRQTVEQLQKSKSSLEKLIQEHRQKLADYKRDPFAFDNKGTLRNAPEELRPKIIDGRINALEKQISKQEGELQKVNDLLGGGQ